MSISKREFYIVDRKILSTSIQKVIEVSELIQSKDISTYEAIKKKGISRSTYYKYKDYVKPFFEEKNDVVFSLYLFLEDKPGILSKILDSIAESEMNILTIIQNIPIDKRAGLTISIRKDSNSKSSIKVLLDNIREIKGVKDIRVLGNS